MTAETPATATITAKQLRELNHYWHVLSALVNELGMARTMGDSTLKERLAKIGELEQWARKRMSWRVPPSVVAEDKAQEAERKRALDADTSDEAMARKGEQREMEAYRLDLAARGLHHFYRMDEDGAFHEHIEPIDDEPITVEHQLQMWLWDSIVRARALGMNDDQVHAVFMDVLQYRDDDPQAPERLDIYEES
jgi:hypothetical protein